MANQDLPNVQQVHQYTSHNFDSVNRAIDNEVQKQEMWTALYRNHRIEKTARIVFYLLSSVCIVALTGVLIWWLLVPSYPVLQGVSGLISVDESLTANKDLKVISANEQVEGSEQAFINTSFTVFHRTLTPSGEEVVTGKTYLPSRLDFPEEQYCYLESVGRQGALEAKPLAIYDAGKIQMETKDKSLQAYAEAYCRFSSR